MHYKPNSVDVEAGEKAEREGLEENGADEDSNSPRDHRWQSLHIEKPMKSFVSQKEYQNRPIGGSTFLNSPGNKTLYDEIYYVSGIKENYFMMISDNMQLLELPLGLVKEEVKLGQPIRVRLETDGKRWQTD